MSLVEVLSMHLSVVTVLHAEDRSRIFCHDTVVRVRLFLDKTKSFCIAYLTQNEVFNTLTGEEKTTLATKNIYLVEIRKCLSFSPPNTSTVIWNLLKSFLALLFVTWNLLKSFLALLFDNKSYAWNLCC